MKNSSADWQNIFKELSSDELEKSITVKKKLFLSDLDVKSIISSQTVQSSLTLVPNSSSTSIQSIKDAVKPEISSASQRVDELVSKNRAVNRVERLLELRAVCQYT